MASDLFFFTTPGGTFKVVMADAHENRCKRQPFIHSFLKRKNFNYFLVFSVKSSGTRVESVGMLVKWEGRQIQNSNLPVSAAMNEEM